MRNIGFELSKGYGNFFRFLYIVLASKNSKNTFPPLFILEKIYMNVVFDFSQIVRQFVFETDRGLLYLFFPNFELFHCIYVGLCFVLSSSLINFLII